MTEHTAKQVLTESIKSITSAWNHDGGEALGNLSNKILGGYKLVIRPASPSSLSRLWVKVIDHFMNRHTPWFRNTQVLPHRLRILGNPRTQAIDLQIPTQPGQTSLEVILLTLQIMGCERENPQYDSERIRVSCQPEPTRSEHKGLLPLQPHSTFELTDRLTMFLPAREHAAIWGSACLAEDTEILLADGTFVSLLHSIGKAIGTDQQDTRRIKRIHKFDTLETDLPLYEIEGNWMTASHFTRKGTGEKWHRALEREQQTKKKDPPGTCLRGGIGHGQLPDTSGGRPGGYRWKLPDSGTIQTRLYSRFPFQHGPGSTT